ncbi:MAG: NYN domain-containing protein [Thermoanaerobaculia bacterium]
MPYVVDGNNLIGRLLGKARPREEDRRELLRRIAECLRGMRARVLVVFDGPSESGRDGAAMGPLTIRYSGNRSADDVIVEIALRSPSPADQRVVTDDRDLASRARDAGATVVPAEKFLTLISSAVPVPASAKPVDVPDWEAFFSDDRNRL